MSSKKNSFVSIAEQIQLLNNNSVQILASLNKLVTSNDSSVNVIQLSEDGSETMYSLPTVGKLYNDINVLNNNLQTLSTLNESNTHIQWGKSTKKIFLTDLNKEPNGISKLNTVSNFKPVNNWFFESLMNPMLVAQFDVTNEIENDVDGVISRRYIVKFEQDNNGDLTESGQVSKDDFINKFLGKDDIYIEDFIDWYTIDTNVGVINNKTPLYDEQHFTFEYQETMEYGVFSVIEQETDTINNKMWFHLYSNEYVDINGTKKILSIGDELILNKKNSTSRWVILETSVSSSNFRIRLERVEGFDPVPTGTNVLKFYSSIIPKKIANVSVGFDEYIVVFMKPTNSKNMTKSFTWSRGVGIFTNELVLDTDNNISMAEYYLKSVQDYGMLLKDLIDKTIPTQVAVKPNPPALDDTNFKVVQINKHLTNNVDRDKLKNLDSEKNKTKNKIDEINQSIISKNKEMGVKGLNAVKVSSLKTEKDALILERESLTRSLITINQQIIEEEKIEKIEPKYRIRGFWTIPDPQYKIGQKPQEIIQFHIQYKYMSKDGTENKTEDFSIQKAVNDTKISSNPNSSIINNPNVSNEGGVVSDNRLVKSEIAYFSNWIDLRTPTRKRTYDEINKTWYWETEIESNPDVVNINQLDIPISQGEKVEIRISSVSEVGYPDSIIESSWSNSITINFPDELNAINIDESVKQSVMKDSILLDVENSLNNKGVNQHISNSYTFNDEYVAHIDEEIITNYKNDQNENLTLREYLKVLTDKIQYLEGIITQAKGKMVISVFNGVEEISIDNNSIVNLNFNCIDYANKINYSTYKNTVGIITDCYLKIDNISTSQLSFLVRDSYNQDSTIRRSYDNLPCLIDANNDFVVQEKNQWIYFSDNFSGENLYSGNTLHFTGQSGYSGINEKITSVNIQPGLSGDYVNKFRTGNETGSAYNALLNGDWDSGNKFATLICPKVNSINDFISDENVGNNFKLLNGGEKIIIPFNIYWKFKTNTSNSVNILVDNINNLEHQKTLNVVLNPSSNDNLFQFCLKFNIKTANLTAPTTGISPVF